LFTGVSTVWLATGLTNRKQRIIHSVDLFNDIMPMLLHCGYLANLLNTHAKSVDAAQLSHRVKFYKIPRVEKVLELLSRPIIFFSLMEITIEGCVSDFMYFIPMSQLVDIYSFDIYLNFVVESWPKIRY